MLWIRCSQFLGALFEFLHASEYLSKLMGTQIDRRSPSFPPFPTLLQKFLGPLTGTRRSRKTKYRSVLGLKRAEASTTGLYEHQRAKILCKLHMVMWVCRFVCFSSAKIDQRGRTCARTTSLYLRGHRLTLRMIDRRPEISSQKRTPMTHAVR